MKPHGYNESSILTLTRGTSIDTPTESSIDRREASLIDTCNGRVENRATKEKEITSWCRPQERKLLGRIGSARMDASRMDLDLCRLNQYRSMRVVVRRSI
ncbi:hypothetical protein Bca4012_063211 [Brassica carinata]